MKKLHGAIAVLAMLFLNTAILITSFQAAAYGDSQYKFFEKAYARYQVTESLDMEMKDVMDVTEHMMGYLIGEEEELSVITDVDGETQDFFNEQDRLHMEDVKRLFLGGLNVRTACIVIFAVMLVLLAFMKADLKRVLPGAFSAGIGLYLIIVVILGLLFASDFTRYFTVFHEIFFTNDLWLFDPAADYMIRMLPEGFFADMALRIGVIFVGILAAVWVVLRVWRAALSNKKNLSKN